MDKYVLAKLLAELAQGHFPTPEDITMLIQDNATHQQLLQHPALVTALIARATVLSGVDCDTVEGQLGTYIDDEFGNNQLGNHYQPVRIHLQGCPLCYEGYRLVRTIITAQQAGAVPRWPLQAYAGIVLKHADLRRSAQECNPTAGSTVQVYANAVPDLPATVAHITMLRQDPDPNVDWQLTIMLEGAAIAGLRVMLRYETELQVEHTDLHGYTCFSNIPACWLFNENGTDLLVLFVPIELLPS